MRDCLRVASQGSYQPLLLYLGVCFAAFGICGFLSGFLVVDEDEQTAPAFILS